MTQEQEEESPSDVAGNPIAPLAAEVPFVPVRRSRPPIRRAVELAFFVAALALLWYLLDRAGWANIGQALGRMGAVGAIVIVLVGFAETLLDAVALHAALCRRMSLTRVVFANSAGAVINNFAPWDLGEVAKGAIMGRRASATSTISAVVIWNYAFKLTRPIVSLSAAVAGALLWKAASDELVGIVLLANVLAFAPYVVLRLLLRTGPAHLLARAAGLLPWKNVRSPALLAGARTVDATVRSFATDHAPEYAVVITSQLAARIVSFSALYVTNRLAGFDYDLSQMALVYAGLNVADYVVAALPARIGVSEGAAFAIFQLYGLSPEAGVIIYLILRFKMLVSNGLPAAFALYGLEHTPPRP